jgi:hypothetical protein
MTAPVWAGQYTRDAVVHSLGALFGESAIILLGLGEVHVVNRLALKITFCKARNQDSARYAAKSKPNFFVCFFAFEGCVARDSACLNRAKNGVPDELPLAHRIPVVSVEVAELVKSHYPAFHRLCRGSIRELQKYSAIPS